jgi:UDP-N-acetyl-2-amino-2-deoxyglucuronate dehydrogenase
VSDQVRVGVIGLGMVSGPHLDGYEQADGATLAAVCDADLDKTERVAEQRGIPGTTDYREILSNPEIDAVALLLPHPLHHPVAREALESGKHVCVEKPLTVTEGQAIDLIELAAERELTLTCAENTRFVAAYEKLAEMVHAGELGQIRMVHGFIPDQILGEWEMVDDPTQTWKREPHGCGAIIDCAPHMLELLIWLFGEVAQLQTFSYNWVPEIELENHAVIAGRMRSGPLFSIELCSLTEYPRGERVEVYGSDGTVIIDQVLDPPMVIYRDDRDAHGTPVGDITYDLKGWKPHSIRATALDFISAIRGERAPAISAHEFRYVVRLVELAYQSRDRGGVPVDAAPGLG